MFNHLHVHSTYSTLDGLAQIEELAKKASSFNMSALCITDHGSCSGHKDLEKISKQYGLKPIYGCEFYMCRGEQPTKEDSGYHIILLAKNREGLENMYKLYHYSYELFYRKPHITFSLLKRHSKGLICTSACIGSIVAQDLLEGRTEAIKQFKDIFGEDFYLEIQPQDLPDQFIVNRETIKYGKKFNIPVIATNDVHYVEKEDNKVHEVLLAMQINKKWSDPKRWKFPTDDYYFKSREEMNLPDEYLDNTQLIVDKIETFDLPKGNFMPHYTKLAPGQSEREALEEIVWNNFESRYNGSESVREAVKHELDVIDGEGYSGYFLIVQDYIKQARENGVLVGVGRGSGAGSKVAYLTDITKVDPNKYGLIFERFLDRGRIPDIDVDVSNQDWVFKYFQSIYGEKNVARIVTFGRLTAKAVVRKVMSVFEYSMQEIKEITSEFPDINGDLMETFNSSDKVKDFALKNEWLWKCMLKLNGCVSNEGKHAGGVVICEDLINKLPVKIDTDDNGNRNVPVAMLTKYPLEEAGFVKLDVLGLATLPIIKDCLDMIDEEVDIDNINLNDPELFKMLSEGDTSGVFQLATQSAMIMKQKPKCFQDIVNFTSIIRPGTGDINEYMDRYNGKEWWIEPERQKYLNQSKGLMIFQEQYLEDAKTYANWHYGFSDKHIRKNKKLKEDEELFEKFIEDGIHNGYKQKQLTKIWKEIVEVAGSGYGFNKSHAVVYSVITMQTAYLKHYYPKQWYCALMNSKIADQTEIAGLVAECKRKKINILPPDVNKSGDKFIVTEEGISMPINYLKRVSGKAIKGLQRLRPIHSLEDVIERRNKSEINKTAIIAMIKAGCFDFQDKNRANLIQIYDMSERNKTQIKNGYIPPLVEYNTKVRLSWEKEVLGMYVSEHPLANHNPVSMADKREGEDIIQVVEIEEVAERYQKNGRRMAFITASNNFGNLKILAFAETWVDCRNIVKEGEIMLIDGRKNGDSIIAYNIERIDI